MRRPAVIALAAYVAALAAFTAFVALPFLDEKRDTPAEVPSPAPLTATDLVLVGPSGRLCMTNLALSRESAQVRFKVGTYHRPGQPLAITLRAAGYSARASIAAGYADNSTLAANIPPPPSGRLATVCIRNEGSHQIAFYAAADRARSQVLPFVNGKLQRATPMLSFDERQPVSIAQRAGVTAGRIAVFRGFLDHAWIVWLLAIAMLVGAPLLAGAALAAARDQPPTDDSSPRSA